MDYGGLSSLKMMDEKSVLSQIDQPMTFVHVFEKPLLIHSLDLPFELSGAHDPGESLEHPIER